MYLIYTGHHYYGDGDPDNFWQNQNLAISEDGIHFKKYENNPIIAQAPEDNTQHFRDPKVWYDNGNWNMILGSQNKEKVGRVLLYRSSNLIDWDYIGPISQSNSTEKEGYMWECPDFFRLGDNDILLTSPQGIKEDNGRFKNLNETGYFVGKYSYASNQYDRGEFAEIDNGHDFYATQTTLTPDGRRVVIGWMDMWESPMPESADGWAGALTLPRELVYKDNILQMKPIKELEQLRTETLLDESYQVDKKQHLVVNAKQYEALLKFDMKDINEAGIELKDSRAMSIMTIKYNKKLGKVVLNRAGDDPEREALLADTDELKLHIYVDTSSVEIFVNDGQRTFTERFYNDMANIDLIADESTNVSATIYKLDNKAVKF